MTVRVSQTNVDKKGVANGYRICRSTLETFPYGMRKLKHSSKTIPAFIIPDTRQVTQIRSFILVYRNTTRPGRKRRPCYLLGFDNVGADTL